MITKEQALAKKITDDFLESIKDLPEWVESPLKNFFNGEKTYYKDIIPNHLEADFNGDGKNDVALFIVDVESKKRGIVIFHQGSSEPIIIGAGIPFDERGYFDDINFVDLWKLHNKEFIEEPIIGPNEEVTYKKIDITATGIVLAKNGSGGGILYWDGQKYQWVTTGI